MRSRPIYKVDAFTRQPLQGNPAGVVPFGRGLSDEEMVAVARELNFTETAFVMPSRAADLKLRFYTPTQEVPFCGHALVASLALLRELGEVPVKADHARVRVETSAGTVSVEIVRDEEGFRIDMTQVPPAFRPFAEDVDHLLDVLGASSDDLREDLPVELAFTGLWHLLVPLTSLDALDGLLPDLRALAALNREVGALTTHVFVEEGDAIHCRDFAPAAGIDEDPVTGSASGALGAYLLRHDRIRAEVPITMIQGESCGRPGRARVVVKGNPGEPTSVIVGGHAVVSVRGEIRLPETS